MRNCQKKMYGNPSDDLCNAQNKHMIRLVVFNHKDKCICVSIKGTASREKYCVLQYDVLLYVRELVIYFSDPPSKSNDFVKRQFHEIFQPLYSCV